MASTTTTTSSTSSSTSLNISGVTSGLDWNSIVDTSISALEARTVTPISDEITLRNSQKDAWNQLQTLVETLNTSALAMRKSGFGGFTATATTSAESGRSLVTATTSSTASAGQYKVEVQQLAQTAKLGSSSVSDTTAARGLSGTLTVNGKAVTVASTDSLTAIRDKINAAGAGVTATVVSDGGTAGRLVLTANSSGASGITLQDDSASLSRELGFVDTQSKPISSATAAAAAALGMSVYPQPASIRIGNTTITADLSTESISSIAAKINAAGGSASVEPETYGDETRYRLKIDGNVTAVAGDANSQAVIDALGLTTGTSGSVHQTVQGAVLTSGGSAVTTSTALAGLSADGTATNLAVGDAINIRGVRGDGTTVSIGMVVQAGDTMQTLLDRLNDATSGFGSGTRTATASLGADGRIRLGDDTGGASRLSFSMSITHSDGTTASLGSSTTAVAGRSRELQTGSDAVFLVDGQQYTRTSNTVSDVLTGVTLNLQSAEVGTSVDLTVARNTDGAVTAAKSFVDAYNAIRSFVDGQGTSGSPLYGDSSLRMVMNSFTDALRTKVSDNGTYTSGVNIGMVLDRNGKLTFDEATFTKAYTEKPSEVESLFGYNGIGGAFVTATDNATRYGVGAISSRVNGLIQKVYTLTDKETEAKKRLDDRRAALVAQYTAMEEALSKLQSQGNSLTSMISGLNSSS